MAREPLSSDELQTVARLFSAIAGQPPEADSELTSSELTPAELIALARQSLETPDQPPSYDATLTALRLGASALSRVDDTVSKTERKALSTSTRSLAQTAVVSLSRARKIPTHVNDIKELDKILNPNPRLRR